MLLIPACHLVKLYICAKFHEIISNGIKVIERTRKITKGNNSTKNVGGMTVVKLCMSSSNALYFCQVS